MIKLGSNLGPIISEYDTKPTYKTQSRPKRANHIALVSLPWAQGVRGSNPRAPTNNHLRNLASPKHPCLGGHIIEQFEQFIRERQFICNVSLRTVEWYRQSFAWLDAPDPTNDQLKSLVIRMRERGLKPAGCNNRIRALNAYLQTQEFFRTASVFALHRLRRTSGLRLVSFSP